MGQWVGEQRHNRDTLSPERTVRLDALGFVWNEREAGWEEGFSYLKAYKEREGHCYVPAKYKTPDGYRLGPWVSVQRLSQDKLTSERKARLDALGFDWNPHDTAWEEGFNYLNAYKEREGHCRVPQRQKEHGFPLGQWVSVQRATKDALSAERRQRLGELGFVWATREADWEEGFSYLKAYKEREGHCRPPVSHVENSFRLGTWVDTQRQRKARMSQERIQRLDELGFVWDPREADWEEGFSYLKVFKQREGHCRVPYEYKENGYRLGQWVTGQRVNKDTLSSERRKRLDDLGFVWDPLGLSWEKTYQELVLFKKDFGHCNVPQQWSSNPGLSRWVHRQRQAKRAGKLSAERIGKLQTLGLKWSRSE